MRSAFRSFIPLHWRSSFCKRSRPRIPRRPHAILPRLEQLEDRITPTGPFLAFEQQPSDTIAGATMSPVTVAIKDQFGNIETSDNTDAIALSIGPGSPGGTLHGTITLTVSGGEATFNDLAIDQAGTGYTLVANTSASGVSSGASNSFNITPATVDHLAFQQGPTSTVVGAVIKPAVMVALEDKYDNIETGDNSNTISLALSPGGTLNGTTTQTVRRGEATFNDLSINQAADGYTLTASTKAGGVGSLASSRFNIAPAQITTTAVNVAVPYIVSSQTVSFNASVADASVPSNMVDEGIVTFTVLNGTTVIGTPVEGAVSSGKANASFTVPAALTAGNYTLAVSYSDSAGNFTDSGDTNASFTVALAPAVTANPSSQTVNAGDSVTFTAEAVGNPAPTVQWRYSSDGGKTFTNIGTATSTTLTLKNVQAQQSGDEFQAVFTNSSGAATTLAAVLTVQYAPIVTTPPSSQTVTAGRPATFMLAVNGNPTPSVEWEVSSDGGKTWTIISGSTSTTLTLDNVQPSQNGYQYLAILNNSLGSVTTNPVLLTVQTTPAITSGNSATFTAGRNASFTVTATGLPTPILTESGTLPSGITFAYHRDGTATLAGTAAIGTQGTYHFTIAAHNGVGSDFTQDFTLTVNAATVPPSPPPSPAPSPPVSPHLPPALNVPPLLALLNSFLTRIETLNANGTETVTDSLFGTTLIVSTYDSSGNFVSATLLGITIPNWIWNL